MNVPSASLTAEVTRASLSILHSALEHEPIPLAVPHKPPPLRPDTRSSVTAAGSGATWSAVRCSLHTNGA